ncbi:MAG: hypothetical protein EB078_13090 [Proteobacteria bacterium]|nr:hypothetical protein [Pseudomonadota bacterium]NDC25652.1 hypothetical protein [Pseudomonadota bacterium]NDD05833.1 hypothetical protein [Pseudomonadota bacterium]NDG28284.1 hypothetical protein [Pseudomonadota bacterium]
MNFFTSLCFLSSLLSLTALSLPAHSTNKIAEVFEGERACFLLKNSLSKNTDLKWGGRVCSKEVSPNQTFYLPLTLIANDLGLLQDEKTLFKWDGTHYENPTWNKDQFAVDWIQNRVDWVTERLTRQIGKEPLKKYLSMFRYGNESTDPRELKMSPVKQLAFAETFFQEAVQVKSTSWALTKKLFYIGKYRAGIEVWGQKGEDAETAWFVGQLRNQKESWTFVTLMTKGSGSKEPVTSERAQALSMDALTQLKLF